MEVAQLLLSKQEENRKSKDELLMSGLCQKSLGSGLVEISSTECEGGRQELQNAPERVPREKSFEKVGQDIVKTKR